MQPTIELKTLGSWDPYLPDLILSHLGLRIDDFDVEPVETGMMNFVFRVHTDKGNFFLKQALPRAKAGRELGPALRTISSQRLGYERNCINAIRAFQPDGAVIPTVYHYDRVNQILLLKDVAGKDGVLLETSLRDGVFNVQAASAVGRFLGGVHRGTWGVQRSIRGSRRNDRKNWERFLDMRTRGISTDGINPEILKELNNLHKQALREQSHDVLIWMDCCPKNIVVRKDRKVGVIDFELSSWVGDPAYDLGFFIGHYLIHAILQNLPETALHSIASAIHAYWDEVKGMVFQKNVLKRTVKFSAATVIYRIAGASCLRYIDPASVPKLIEKAKKLLCSGISGVPEKVIPQIADALA